jgi:hypothetical protein
MASRGLPALLALAITPSGTTRRKTWWVRADAFDELGALETLPKLEARLAVIVLEARSVR